MRLLIVGRPFSPATMVARSISIRLAGSLTSTCRGTDHSVAAGRRDQQEHGTTARTTIRGTKVHQSIHGRHGEYFSLFLLRPCAEGPQQIAGARRRALAHAPIAQSPQFSNLPTHVRCRLITAQLRQSFEPVRVMPSWGSGRRMPSCSIFSPPCRPPVFRVQRADTLLPSRLALPRRQPGKPMNATDKFIAADAASTPPPSSRCPTRARSTSAAAVPTSACRCARSLRPTRRRRSAANRTADLRL